MSSQRKQEVLGLILLVVAILLGLAVVTYDPADDTLARAFSWGDVFDLRGNRAENALGLVGATIAYGLVPELLGYPVLILVGLLAAWGYLLFRQKTPLFLPLVTGLGLAGTVILACLIGWWDVRTEADLALWSGGVGRGVAGWMGRVFGAPGSLILLLLAGAVTVLLLVDRDIQITLDRVEDAFRNLKDWAKERWSGYREGSAERAEQRRELLEERRAARQEAREEALALKEARPEKPERRSARRPKPERPAALPEPALPEPDDDLRQLVQDTRSRRASEPEEGQPTEFAPIFRGDGPPPEPPPAGTPPRQAAPAAAHAEPALHVRLADEEETADLDQARLPDAGPDARSLPYEFPSIDLLDEPDARIQVDMAEIEENKQILLDKLETYNIEITEIDAIVGPTVTQYELTPAPGIKISRITALEDDLAMALAASGIRIIAPIPGKTAIGVEIPNRSRELVRVRSVLATKKFRDAARAGSKGGMALPVPIGKTIEGEVYIEDLAKMPHLLIAGATGSGKSVGLNTLIAGLLYACHPANLKFVMVDPKKIELNAYAALLDHYIAMPEDAEDPVITDFNLAAGVLKCCEREMEGRYDLLAAAGVRGIKEYNAKVAAGGLDPDEGHRHLPYIVVIIDELADLMMTAGKEVEPPIARLAQMARAVGIHLVLATQRPSVDVITGLIKANFPARMAYQVSSRIDSRTIIDQGGAQQLVGNGDLLYMNGSKLVRLQGPFLSVDEVDRLVAAVGAQKGAGPYMLPPLEPEGGSGPGALGAVDDRDELFEEAAKIIVRSQQGSVSLLQRKLSVGYTRAARLVDQLEEAGIVGPFEGSKARQVLVEDEIQLDALLSGEPIDGEA